MLNLVLNAIYQLIFEKSSKLDNYHDLLENLVVSLRKVVIVILFNSSRRKGSRVSSDYYSLNIFILILIVFQGELCFNSKKYAGTVWYKMTGRKFRYTSQTPGPGEYDPKYTLCAQRKEDLKIREMKKKYAKIPRSYTQIAIQRAEREVSQFHYSFIDGSTSIKKFFN